MKQVFSALQALWMGLWHRLSGPEGRRWYLVIGFTIVSFVGTYLGVLDVMRGDNNATVDFVPLVAVGVVVALLTVSMVYALMMARLRIHIIRRLFAGAYYVLVLIVSVSFGFAFWWGFIASKGVTFERYDSQNLTYQNSLERIRDVATNKKVELETLQAQNANAVPVEAKSGGTCDQPSVAGEGPFYRTRVELSRKISGELTAIQSTVSTLTKSVESEIQDINDFRAESDAMGSEERADSVRTRNRDMVSRVNTLNTNYAEPLRGMAQRLESLAVEIKTPSRDEQGREKCTDTPFSSNLSRIATDLLNVADLQAPDVKAAEGSASTMEALGRLGTAVVSVVPGLAGAGGGAGLRPIDAAALVIASLVDLGLLLFAMLLPTEPLSGGFGAKQRPEVIEERLRFYASKNRNAFTELLALRFNHAARHFIVEPRGRWEFVDPEGEDSAVPGRIKMMKMSAVAVHLNHAQLLRRYFMFAPSVWPWKKVRESAREALHVHGWSEAKSERGSLDESKSGIYVYTIDVADLDSLLSLDTSASAGDGGKHSAMGGGADTRKYVDISAEASQRINEIVELDREIQMARQRPGFQPMDVQAQVNRIFVLRSFLARERIELTGDVGLPFQSDLHMDARAPLPATNRPHNVIVETVQHGFVRRAQGRSEQLTVILPAHVVRTEAAAWQRYSSYQAPADVTDVEGAAPVNPEGAFVNSRSAMQPPMSSQNPAEGAHESRLPQGGDIPPASRENPPKAQQDERHGDHSLFDLEAPSPQGKGDNQA